MTPLSIEIWDTKRQECIPTLDGKLPYIGFEMIGCVVGIDPFASPIDDDDDHMLIINLQGMKTLQNLPILPHTTTPALRMSSGFVPKNCGV